MARASKKETWVCKSCKQVNPLASNIFQATTCFVCGAKHAMVNNGGKREFLPFHYQDREEMKRPQVNISAE